MLEKDRIGSPAFLRCVLQVAGDTANLLPSVAEMAALANGWMPSSPASGLCTGGAEATQITVMVHYVGGQMRC